jgi:hypothetical protein
MTIQISPSKRCSHFKFFFNILNDIFTNVNLNDIRTNVNFNNVCTHVLFLALGRINVDPNDPNVGSL